MTPKRYTQDSRLIRWAFLWEEFKPLQTSTCALFWRAAVFSPLKILAPLTCLGLIFWIAGCLTFHIFLPDWYHASWIMDSSFDPATHANYEPPLQFNAPPRGLVYLVAIVSVVWLACIIAYNAGLWGLIHKLCKPVEIEGGLIQKGRCPHCAGRMIETTAGLDSEEPEPIPYWKCTKCTGVFYFTASDALDDDDEDEKEDDNADTM